MLEKTPPRRQARTERDGVNTDLYPYHAPTLSGHFFVIFCLDFWNLCIFA